MFDNILSPFFEFANQKFNWLGEDNEENFNKHKADPRLAQSGWLEKSIEYKFNNHGYRTDNFVFDTPCICAFGCSLTMGTAMRHDELYLAQCGKELDLQTYNFGIGGGSDSTSFRLALTWLSKLNVKLVIYQQTFAHRVELICDQIYPRIHGVNATLGGDTFKDSGEFMRHWALTDANGDLLAIKNYMAMKDLCNSLNIKLISIQVDDFFKHVNTWARDLKHPGLESHQHVANKILNNV